MLALQELRKKESMLRFELYENGSSSKKDKDKDRDRDRD